MHRQMRGGKDNRIPVLPVLPHGNGAGEVGEQCDDTENDGVTHGVAWGDDAPR